MPGPTLLKWSKEYSRELEQAQYFELNSLLAQYGLMRKNRVEGVSVLLQAVMEEMKKRTQGEILCRLPTDKLFSLFLALEGRLEQEITGKKLEFSSARDMDFLLASYVEVD